MTRVLAFGFGVLLALAVVAAGALFNAHSDAGQGGAYAAESVECWRVVGVIGALEVELRACPELVPAPDDPTPSATPDPSPTPSLTPPATNTPRPTDTPTHTPTVTPTPQATAPEASPTPEVGTPIPVTPGPTLPPPDFGCFGVVQATSLNVRSIPGATGTATVIGSVSYNQSVRVLEVQHIADGTYQNTWLRIRVNADLVGWSAGYYRGVDYIKLDLTEACDFAQWGTDGGALLTRARGWTILTGFSNIWAQLGALFLQAKTNLGVTIAGETGSIPSILAAGGYVNWRPHYDLHLPDCGDKVALPAGAAAWARVNALAPYVNTMLAGWGVVGSRPARVVIQLENECWFPSAEYARDWLIAAVAACDAQGWTCTPHVFSTGNPNVAWLPVLAPALETLARREHYYGLNVGPFKPGIPLCEDRAGSITDYTTWYGRMIRQHAPANLRMLVSEAAAGDATSPPDLADAKCFVKKADGLYNWINLWYAAAHPWREGDVGNWSTAQVLDFARALAG